MAKKTEWSGRSHLEVLSEIKTRLTTVLKDPLLSDIGTDATSEDLSASIALLRGQALTLQLRCYDDQSLPLVVLQGSTVHDVMQAVERATKPRVKQNWKAAVVSWSYVWKTYWLACGQVRLEDKSARLTDYGVTNHSELRFVKKQKRT
ncbi:U11/U12 small nuclear ribonucleoprotein 25 kDa protein [Geodia barretti]|uniref:U11/U12 small nuclear ribonucleoprotein 25 kDa protein n=1 Tax=Geodia barretti TaxID=519541 RepID=A0AA35TIH5_GEOBA|nr:U11/U12 small nuclear ribonucleoprotein 25 kDa protein [Geodia barretti]